MNPSRPATEQTPRHPIRVVARRAGLTPEGIRAWESRYGAVRPARSPSGRRLYSDADLERLVLLKGATGAGRSIGQVASLSTIELAALIAEDGSPASAPSRAPEKPASLQEMLTAVRDLEMDRFEGLVRARAVSLPAPALIATVLVPLMQAVGEEWHSGRLGVAHEHLASAIVRGVLAGLPRSVGSPPGASTVVVATPAGQLHELGAMSVAAAAWADGWRVLYLGASVPADALASAVAQSGARLVALSITCPDSGSRLGDELALLRRAAPEVPILVGGRGAARYRRTLVRIGASLAADTDSPAAALARLRRRAA